MRHGFETSIIFYEHWTISAAAILSAFARLWAVMVTFYYGSPIPRAKNALHGGVDCLNPVVRHVLEASRLTGHAPL